MLTYIFFSKHLFFYYSSEMDEPEPHHTATPDQGEPITDHVTPDMLNPNRRLTIDHVVYQWTLQQQAKDKVVTPNTVRQKAFEIGQQYDPNFKASLNWYNNWKKRFDYQESPEVEALKRKKKSYTAAFKLFAVQRVMELDSISQASLELNVSRRCLQRWKEELDVITTVAEQASNAVYRRPGQGRKVTDTSLDLQLLDWVDGKWKEGVTVTSVMVRQRARELSENPEFKASLGWFVKWQKRHNVDLKEKTIYSPMQHETQETPLKLRLLPEGQAATYTDRPRTTKKRKREYDEVVLQESDEEFDRLLLTWLVERWEVGETVTDKLLREKAAEISPSADFHPSKGWVALWKQKYNVSLESQTYGNAGEAEGEIVEETPVYDEVTIHEGNPLTPTKEEAATTLASLAADEHGVNIGAREGAEVMDVPNASGLEIAEALQKLASAFGLTQVPSILRLCQLVGLCHAGQWGCPSNLMTLLFLSLIELMGSSQKMVFYATAPFETERERERERERGPEMWIMPHWPVIVNARTLVIIICITGVYQGSHSTVDGCSPGKCRSPLSIGGRRCWSRGGCIRGSGH